MHVLIIGGTRFVGYLLTWRLLACGHRVTLVTGGTLTDPFADRVERLRCDRKSADFARLLRGRHFDAAVDFAAYKGADARQAVEVLGGGAVGHYVFVSSGQVYLVREQCARPAQESDYDGPLMPEPTDAKEWEEWDYGMGKRAAEDVLDEAWHSRRFPGTRLRIPMVNGERDYYRRIESYLWRILDGGQVLLPDGGTEPTRHVYGWDVATAISRLLGQSTTFGQAYNLCQEDSPTLAELVDLMAATLGADNRSMAVPRAMLQNAGIAPEEISPFSGRWMSFLVPAKAKQNLDWQPQRAGIYVPKVVMSFLASPPAGPPNNYRHRPTELALAARLR